MSSLVASREMLLVFALRDVFVGHDSGLAPWNMITCCGRPFFSRSLFMTILFLFRYTCQISIGYLLDIIIGGGFCYTTPLVQSYISILPG